MIAQFLCNTMVGLEARFVQIEAEMAPGLPGFHLVGLPDASVAESVHRVRSALRSVNYPLPPRRVTVNLAPGDLRKEGTRFDLAIALAILAVAEQFPIEMLHDTVIIGELGLDGGVRPVRGCVSSALALRERRLTRLVLPVENARELSGIEGLQLFPVSSLQQALQWLRGESALVDLEPPQADPKPPLSRLAQVVGQPLGIRALEVAAAGAHHLLWLGPPGCGKTMLSECLSELLPDLDAGQQLEVAAVSSALSSISQGAASRPPFSAPHSRISAAALLGSLLPGEVSRAHHGVLFLDELPEFRRDCLEGLRTALESGWVEVGRSKARFRYPARFQLIAACNPCPCGYYGAEWATCRCPELRRKAYLQKISGPIRDRLDLQVYLDRPDLSQVWSGQPAASSDCIQALQRVQAARERQRQRGELNRDLQREHFLDPRQMHSRARSFLESYSQRWHLSVRASERVARISRTLADLDGRDQISDDHVAEAVGFRHFDRWRQERG